MKPKRAPKQGPPKAGKASVRPTRLAILVNTIAPYRLPMYAALSDSFDTLVLHGGREANRSWTLDLPPSLKTREVWTLQIPVKKQTGIAGVWDTQYLHLNAGLFWWLPVFRPGAILTNELGLRTLIAVIYGRLTGVPVWVQWEGTLHSERHLGGLKRIFRRFLMRCIRHWVSYGASSSAYLRSLGVNPAQLLEVQNCVPHQTFLKEPETAVKWLEIEPRPLILSVGQLIPRKGLDLLIEACARLQERGVAFTLLLVGQGPERERLEQQARRRGITHFHILPNQDQEVLNALYRAADAFVFPSLEDVWGLVVSEALWAGAPVLCSKFAGCAEIIAEENVFDPTSVSSFDQALCKVLESRVAPADRANLMTCEQVSGAIQRSIVQGSPAPADVLRTPTPPHALPNQR